MSRRRGGKRRPGQRVESLLDQISGKADPPARERGINRWVGHRTLDVQRHQELFKSLVAQDFDFLMGQNFAAGQRTLADLLPQSVLGRAQNGHGWFTDEFGTPLQFPDATFERILSVLETIDPNLKGYLVRGRRGQMLTRFAEWLFEVMHTPKVELAIDGSPVFGVEFLAEAEVDTRDFLTGLVLAGFMDDWSTRKTAMLHHKRTFSGMPFLLGGGEIYLVDRERFELCGLQETGSTVLVEEQLHTLRDIGVLVRDPKALYSFPEHDQAFFRRRLGDGVSDDLAMIWVGAKFGYGAMLGAFVMDAIDTYDKYVLNLTWGGFDTHLAGLIQEHFLDREGEQLVCDRHLLDLIHFAAKRNDPCLNLSSSHRRFIQIERGARIPTLLNHWKFLQGQPVHDIKLGFSRIPAREFYGVARQRLQSIGVDVKEAEFIKTRQG
ncbi:MAG: hypothetical protein KOO60_06290 [Gemmatimonadales bacterium]|nr:hypothetical protein [Gemmatimonadales bacterium]